MEKIIECKNLTHYYGERKIYEDLSFEVGKGRVVGLLGKNGVGKSTTINILMGFLKPVSGECLILGKNSTKMPKEIKEKVGLLYEGHVQYDFMTIQELEKFYSTHYKKRWKKELYYNLVDKLEVPYSMKISNLSCGQRSQVVLGLIFAQDPEVLILDDYSMGLDVGYRKLFVHYLKNYVKKHNKTVLMTTHVVQDLEELIDDIIILDNKQPLLSIEMKTFKENFKKYSLEEVWNFEELDKSDVITNFENFEDEYNVYSFKDLETVKRELKTQGISYKTIKEESINFEDGFLGYIGRY
ncbi:MAG: ABC transporter ATP-binding protein [Campylobacterales bacterium]|nr:ABC transporter ATP-binding protein [Campylobacterales bacterium]